MCMIHYYWLAGLLSTSRAGHIPVGSWPLVQDRPAALTHDNSVRGCCRVKVVINQREILCLLEFAQGLGVNTSDPVPSDSMHRFTQQPEQKPSRLYAFMPSPNKLLYMPQLAPTTEPSAWLAHYHRAAGPGWLCHPTTASGKLSRLLRLGYKCNGT